MAATGSAGGYPPFRLGESRFDQASFQGRLRHFLDIVDPRTLLTSKSTLERSVKLLEDFRQGTLPPGTTDEQLWKAQKIKQAIIHPDTGKKIFPPFRMSGFVPFGSITVIGLLLPNQSFQQMIFWQWINQSHNACVNYANRNASKPTPTSRFIAGYIGAITSSVGIAVGLSVILRRASALPPATRALIERFVPYPAVATGSVCNVVLMRNSELRTGIDVFDEKGEVVGTSKVAAKKAIVQTAWTRFFLPAPILVIPPIIMTQLEKTKFLRSNPRFVLPVQAVVATLCFGLALPVAISIFPQKSQVPTSALEPEIAKMTSESHLYYNKGL